MKKDSSRLSIILFVVILLFGLLFLYSYYSYVDTQDPYNINDTFVIGNWNLQIFGDKKASNDSLIEIYTAIIKNFDIIFIQEIRDKDASSFYKLCNSLPDYNCNISSRAGRTSSKEQYGIIYLKKFELNKIIDYNVNVQNNTQNSNVQDFWERPPIRADFSFRNYSFSVYNIHTKPNDTVSELKKLELLIDSENSSGNVIVLGDLNADCYYYNPYSEDIFWSWHWVIKSDDDTTTGSSDCAYDRIILNENMNNEYVDYGIFVKDVDENISDHYPVWVRVRDHNYIKDNSVGGFLKSLI